MSNTNIAKIMIKRLLPYPLRRRLKNAYINMKSSIKNNEPYKKGAYPSGINLTGYIKAEMGLGQGCRLIAGAIDKSGIPFSIINYEKAYNARSNEKAWNEKIGEAKYNVNLVQINADQIPLARLTLEDTFWDKRFNIAHFAWELPIFPDRWNNSFRFFDEIWTPSRFCTNVIAEKTTKKVYTMPFGVCADIYEPRNREYFGLPQDKFLFLCMFDVNSVVQRKNPIGAIKAFKRAFSSNCNDVELIIKINNFKEDINRYKNLYKEVSGWGNIRIIDKVLTKNDTNALIKCCDSFVSLHRSEGFGLVMAEAMLLKKSVIATNWSSNTDFMNYENSCPVDYRLVDVGKNYAEYDKWQRWAEPDIDHCAYYMKLLVTNNEYSQRISQKGYETISTCYSVENSAKFIIDRLKELGLIE